MEYLIEDLKASFHLKTGNKRTLLNNAPCAAVAAPYPMSFAPGLAWGASLEPRQGSASPGTPRQMVGSPPPLGWEGGKGVRCASSQAPGAPLHQLCLAQGLLWWSGQPCQHPGYGAEPQHPQMFLFPRAQKWQDLCGLLPWGRRYGLGSPPPPSLLRGDFSLCSLLPCLAGGVEIGQG